MDYLQQELENGVDPNRVAFLTFTRAARLEALQRTGKTEADFPFLRTIHAICYRQLNISQDQIVRPSSLRAFGKSIGIKLTGNNSDPWLEEHEWSFQAPTRDDILLQANHCGRHRKILLKEALKEVSAEIDYRYATWFTKAYRNWKTTEGMLDYTDLLVEYIVYGKPLDIDVMFIDEAQDLSSLQWDVVRKLGVGAKKTYIAGDDDQAIFRWAGADSSAFRNLDANKVEILGQSYRVSVAVHDAATAIVGRIKERLIKDYLPRNSPGEVANAGYLSSIEMKEKTFILFRNHYRGQELARQLKDTGVPFIGYGSPLLEEDVRFAILAWYRLIKNGEIESSLAKKILKYSNPDYTGLNARRKTNEKSTVTAADLFDGKPEWYEWQKYLKSLPGKEILDVCIRKSGFIRTARPKVELLSIHQSKGREAHTVVLDTEMSKATWDAMLTNPDDEHRCWYVAATRAREKLFTLLPDGNYSYRI